MSPSPDFERIRRAVAHEEPDRVPLCEASVDYAIQSRLLGREVAAWDLEAQVEFWLKAGYDYVPLVVGMMAPGKVTRDSAISKVLEEDVLEAAAAAGDDTAWNLEYSSFIEDRRDFERFPWERAARAAPWSGSLPCSAIGQRMTRRGVPWCSLTWRTGLRIQRQAAGRAAESGDLRRPVGGAGLD